MPAFVWIFRKSHRGFTRMVSSFVIWSFSFGVIGALLPFCCARASAGANALTPAPVKMLAIAERRFTKRNLSHADGGTRKRERHVLHVTLESNLGRPVGLGRPHV